MVLDWYHLHLKQVFKWNMWEMMVNTNKIIPMTVRGVVKTCLHHWLHLLRKRKRRK